MRGYYVSQNRCQCHPETCCCNDWAVYSPNGDRHSTFFDRTTAYEVAAALTLYHQTCCDQCRCVDYDEFMAKIHANENIKTGEDQMPNDQS